MSSTPSPATASPRRRPRLGDVLLVAALAALAIAPVAWYVWAPDGDEVAQETALEMRTALLRQAADAQQRALTAEIAAGGLEPGSAVLSRRCDLDPLIPPATGLDGHSRAEHPFPGGPRVKARVFAGAADAALAANRPRDAEVALIAACRQQELASTSPNVPLARVLGRLGDLYLAAARDGGHPEMREGLLARAREVLSLSAHAYAKALGPHSPASRQARQRLRELDESVAVAGMPAPPAPSPDEVPRGVAPPKPTVPSRQAAPESPRQELAAATRNAAGDGDPPLRAEGAAAARALPPELLQLESDIARLKAQAEQVSDDPEGLRMRAQAARARRDRCPDADCLRAWYAARRSELLAEF